MSLTHTEKPEAPGDESAMARAYAPTILAYDLDRFPFRRIMSDHLGIEELEKAHERYGTTTITAENDQETELHRDMYAVGAEFDETYRSFIREWVEPLFGEEVVFQATPGLRYQPPGSVAVGDWHRDSDFGHDRSEINVWVPLTSTERSSSVWIESWPDAGDFHPMSVPHGSAMVFRAAELLHGNVRNESESTRVSFEFRVIRRSAYEPRTARSIKQGKQFEIGSYFDLLPPKQKP